MPRLRVLGALAVLTVVTVAVTWVDLGAMNLIVALAIAVVKATLVAGSQSMANLGGVILQIGEETHGYRLIEVREREAVFERGETSVVLTLEPEGER